MIIPRDRPGGFLLDCARGRYRVGGGYGHDKLGRPPIARIFFAKTGLWGIMQATSIHGERGQPGCTGLKGIRASNEPCCGSSFRPEQKTWETGQGAGSRLPASARPGVSGEMLCQSTGEKEML